MPLLVGLLIYIVMVTWRNGREQTLQKMSNEHVPLQTFISALCGGAHPPQRVDGTAVFPGRLRV